MHIPTARLLAFLPLIVSISAQYQSFYARDAEAEALASYDDDLFDYLYARDLDDEPFSLHRRCTEADRSPVTGDLPAGCQVAEYNPTIDAPLRKRPRPAARPVAPARAPVKAVAGKRARRDLYDDYEI